MDASIEKFRAYHERRKCAKFHCLRTRRIGGDEFGILLAFIVSDPKFFNARDFCATFSKKVAKILTQPYTSFNQIASYLNIFPLYPERSLLCFLYQSF
jgi:hypothetical protein